MAASGTRPAPHDRIIVTAGAWDITPAWWDQLEVSGRLLVPLLLRDVQRCVALEKRDSGMESVSVCDCGFIRLRGGFAGPETVVSADPVTVTFDTNIGFTGSAENSVAVVASGSDACILPFWYRGAVDLNIKDLDDGVGRRLREQAAAAGMSVQQYLRNELTRIAARRSPAELTAGREPMDRADFERIRQRLRDIDAA